MLYEWNKSYIGHKVSKVLCSAGFLADEGGALDRLHHVLGHLDLCLQHFQSHVICLWLIKNTTHKKLKSGLLVGHKFFLLLWSLGFLAKIFKGKFKKGHKKNWTNFLIQIVSTILSSSNLRIFSEALVRICWWLHFLYISRIPLNHNIWNTIFILCTYKLINSQKSTLNQIT